MMLLSPGVGYLVIILDSVAGAGGGWGRVVFCRLGGRME